MTDTSLRSHFPFFQQPQNADLVYFDSAATTQKPQSVLDGIYQYYLLKNANVHRSSFSLAADTTTEFEDARDFVRYFINAKSSQEIIWTKGATESINLVAKSLADTELPMNGRILISATEHHANIVPWQRLAASKQLHIDVIPVDEKGCWDIRKGLALLTEQTCIVALGLVSNALGTIQPVRALLQKAQQVGAITLLDAAQAIAHKPVDVQDLACDYLVFSGHKAFGPTGIGVLYGKREALQNLPVYQTGGEMIKQVSYHSCTFQELPFKFEAGTPNIEGALGLHQGLLFIQQNRHAIESHESMLHRSLLAQLATIEQVRILGDVKHSIATTSFVIEGLDSHDIGILLNEQGIALRVGHHCAMPLMAELKLAGTLRVSLSCYNTLAEIQRFITALKRSIEQINNQTHGALIGHTYDAGPEELADELPLATSIQKARGWDGVYRQIMLAGKVANRLPVDERIDANEIQGCESQVWLSANRDDKGVLQFRFDATGKIVRGLLAIMLEPMQNKTADFIKLFDTKNYLQRLGLSRHLSASRGNGLAAVDRAIKLIADQK
ncbi:SufS family cysteine desulfurase [Aliiglaciecola sp. LCG003]|uniref:SufS family cysteine desulfurase n=1 Tax=Aliiglaciecola sp. LCG003 TaxID=3053655 RepID=UPI0025727440|nr:SufS family cysteine desulfurase [Aliiglaciecola sp. LCG003]WJG07926.1 SufS family cysteine desulfurase [Aliiglaciecola sp. LCG003]